MQITSIAIDLRKNKSVKSARCFSFNHFYCNPNGIEKNTDHYEFSPVRRSNKNRSLNFTLLACNVSLLSEDGRGMHLVTPKQAPKITNSIRWINTSHYAVSHIFAPNIFGHWLESLSENHTEKPHWKSEAIRNRDSEWNRNGRPNKSEKDIWWIDL